jgi:3-dehydroquinate dehydratase/shikimate dehydrogenase
MPKVCVPILVRDPEDAAARAIEARDAGADLIEFRVDECFSGDLESSEAQTLVQGLENLIRTSPLPCILTCRLESEGGFYDGEEASRIALYERLGMVAEAPAYIDIEDAAYEVSANLRQKINLVVHHPGQLRDDRAALLLSMHDFTGRPQDLLRRVARMTSHAAASAIKVVYTARSLRDSLELLDLAADSPLPTIALGMGEFGVLTRVLAPKFAGLLTFASLSRDSRTAPGQPTIHELLNLYRFRSITRDTRVYGVVGWPVSHSLSPLVHNAGFERVGHDAVYLPLPIAAGADPDETYASLKGTLLELCAHPRLNFAGCSVTLPHKEGLVRLARERGWSMDEATIATGAANTLIWDPLSESGRVLNTDVAAMCEVLVAARRERKLDESDSLNPASDPAKDDASPLRAMRVSIIGAGGVARAAAWAAASAGAAVTIHARKPDRGEALARELAEALATRNKHGTVTASPMGIKPQACPHVIINATPLGMANGPAPNQSPLDTRALDACLTNGEGIEPIVIDTVYTPRMTPMLIEAGARGLRTIDGTTMFIAQAALQFEAWTGQAAPRALFTRMVDEALLAK